MDGRKAREGAALISGKSYRAGAGALPAVFWCKAAWRSRTDKGTEEI